MTLKKPPARHCNASLQWKVVYSQLMILIFAMLIFLCAHAQTGRAAASQQEQPPVPSELVLLDSDVGIHFYRKDYPNGNPDYIQILDLNQGASLSLMHAPLSEMLIGKGMFGGLDARFESRSLPYYWQQAQTQHEKAFCVTNGSFFYMPEYPTRLPFSLKIDGKIITEGFGGIGPQAYLGQRLMLELWQDHADISELSDSAFHRSSAPNIIAGLMEDANKNAKKAVARTFVGIQNSDQDGKYETLFLLNTSTAVQQEVVETLRALGAEKIMMLDGGGSTQLMCLGKWVIESERLIPQAIASIAGSPALVSSEVVSADDWTILLTGQNFPLQIEIQNSGVMTWTQTETELILRQRALSSEIKLPIQSQTPPGASLVISQNLAAYAEAGVYPLDIDWAILHQGKVYDSKRLNLTAVVLPEALSDQLPEVQESLKEWQQGTHQEAAQALARWIKAQQPYKIQTQAVDLDQEEQMEERQEISASQTNDGTDEYQPIFRDILIIPLAMSPALIIICLVIARLWEQRH